MPPPRATTPPTPTDLQTLGFSLMAAVAKEDVATVRTLLTTTPPSKRVQLANFQDYDGRRPLHLACSEGFSAIAKELLLAGADPSATDRFGVCCIRDALRHGRLETLRLLGRFSPGFPGPVQPTHVDPNYTLGRDLIAVVASGNVNGAKQLVRQFGANVNFANADGRTALHIAAVKEDAEMVSYLLEAGADMHRTDRWGVSPADEAAKSGSREVGELMKGWDGLEAMLSPELAGIVKEAAAYVVC